MCQRILLKQNGRWNRLFGSGQPSLEHLRPLFDDLAASVLADYVALPADYDEGWNAGDLEALLEVLG